MNNFLFKVLIFIGLLFSFFNVNANVTTDSLILEYKFKHGITNTGKGNASIDIKGDVKTLDIENINRSTGKFDQDRIISKLGWSADEYGKYTISFWYKGEEKAHNGYDKQVLLGSDKGEIFSYNGGNKCSFFDDKISNCKIADGKWHHVIIRKSRKVNYVYIDFKLAYKKTSYINPIGRNLSLGGSYYKRKGDSQTWIQGRRVYLGDYYYYSNGSFHNFRLYSKALDGKDLLALQEESKVLYLDNFENYSDPSNKIPVNFGDIKDKSNYTLSFEAQTDLNKRNSNRYIDQYRYSRVTSDTPQVIFSSEDFNQLYLILDKNYSCLSTFGVFDCSALRDEKKHLFIVEKIGNKNKIYIDNVLVLEKESDLGNLGNKYALNKNYVNIAPNRETHGSRYYRYCPGGNNIWGRFCFNQHKFFGIVENLNFYNGKLSLENKKGIFEKLKGNEIIDNTLKSNLINFKQEKVNIEISNINNKYLKENINYEYSFDGENFSLVESIKQVGSGSNIKYNITIDIKNSLGEKINLSLRVKNENEDYLFFKVLLEREIEVKEEIQIQNPDNSNQTSKTITASFSNGSLYMAITYSEFCSNSLEFEKYNSLIFTSTKDNGKFICYKAITNTGKEIYKSSNEILGISIEEEAEVTGSSVFEEYKTWRYSKSIKSGDSTYAMLSFIGVSNSISGSRNSEVFGGATLVDINGDGLVDLLYNNKNKVNYGYFVNNNYVRNHKYIKYKAILVNNGDYTFSTVYKCVEDEGYYGSCAK